jgi:hypothetical protein
VELSVDKKEIGCRCFFKTKYKFDGIVDNYKVGLVAKGYA